MQYSTVYIYEGFDCQGRPSFSVRFRDDHSVLMLGFVSRAEALRALERLRSVA
jgi:hypothetical protein